MDSYLERGATFEKLMFRCPGVLHGAFVGFLSARVGSEERRRDVVRLARVGGREQRARAGEHAMALVLAVGSVTDFFSGSVVGVLERAHHGRVDADVERFEAVERARGIEQAL